jgi:hypothetical protein
LASDFEDAGAVDPDDPVSDLLVDEPDPSPSDDAAAPDVELSSEPPPAFEAFFAAAVAVDRRSFLAHPEPL